MIRMENENKLGQDLEEFLLESGHLSSAHCSSSEQRALLLMEETNSRAGSSPPDFSMTQVSCTAYPMTASHEISPYEPPIVGHTPPPNGTLYNLNRTSCTAIDYQGQNSVYPPLASSYDIHGPLGTFPGYYPDDYNMPNNYRSFSPSEETTEYHENYQYLSPTSCDSDDSFEVPNTDRSYVNTTRFEHQHISMNETTEFCNVPKSSSNQLPHFATFIEKKVQSRRGRPVTYNKPGYHFSDSDSPHSDEDDTRSVRCRRGAKNILLWKFLLNELRKPDCPHIKWEDERNGIFKFVDTTECSRLWGLMKKKNDMNFEKLSRGIRHYYKDGLMSRRDGIRLVYQFNWHRVPKQFWPKTHRY